ncbi:23S rRNA (uracil(747)-C(5))-methyltransferase RlmC [Kocuria rhizophila]|uniref:23S rRNA (Uracil(747)-C(5))-methyltransferase RlmC n=1 Tax=Kocuria rhizophila TaxID=72000 RepID=A0AAX2SAE7_KOCRH|nr:23S rRNA (uracil(747)-C(5))-methyltransferase RlmC [Kocuria rhizophila]KMK73340.1 23S rRNA methyltransferase [Kocuria rhizophila]TFI00997.1 23S rRNA (uracil(747)-C(5))-methyltransferase RlmC [Kocuria rhizophila]TFI11585.1 23S rRNA (uracil(747)-C(5))-methyltransferase RlmC [Kocuria rhizophila]WIW67798.1 23S rRNA (uracil(747)-C(5))-methyltransferase RlmC [Kocuria sp. ChxB]
MECGYYDRGECRSCTVIEVPYARQLARKQELVRELVDAHGAPRWLEPVASAERGFRNKAKMVVAGEVGSPTLGILDGAAGVDLRDCPLYPEPVTRALHTLAEFIGRVRLLPYDVAKRRGEIKHVIVTGNPEGRLMVRFVLRSTRQLPKIAENLDLLRELVPAADVVSVNIQPEHKAVLEGPEEILLSEQSELVMRLNGIDLRVRPRSFFQTNTAVTEQLYRQVAQWVDAVGPASVWDLYCGVGGFALHVAGPGREVVGTEISEEAVASARDTARAMGLPQDGPGSVRFLADDAAATPADLPGTPELAIVNPPRRGLDASLCAWLETSSVGHAVYSSCNATTLARDLARMPSLRPVEARLLDMFPHTGHYEVAVLLRRG